MTFEEKMKRIEEISALMDRKETGLEESLKLYEEGIRLIRECNEILEEAKLKFDTLKPNENIAE